MQPQKFVKAWQNQKHPNDCASDREFCLIIGQVRNNKGVGRDKSSNSRHCEKANKKQYMSKNPDRFERQWPEMIAAKFPDGGGLSVAS